MRSRILKSRHFVCLLSCIKLAEYSTACSVISPMRTCHCLTHVKSTVVIKSQRANSVRDEN